ncbi:MAG: hypothetical protein A3I87_03195 [Candidatus Staskawiczbacteria bacterium RIFCSPLOWO2_02_FULL_39_8]|nr:MAG: hypothetical protein A3I87_03195 [Candidatus Staskawiczbacteria bacterium RIFCSPLOWO2_02_FULL_39_8]
MSKKLAIISTLAFLMASPLVGLADIDPGPTPGSAQNLDIVTFINAILNLIWPIFIGFAVIMFLVAGFQFLTAQGDPTKVAGARQSIIWGAVGVAVGVLAFSIPFVIRNAIGL